MKEQEQKVWDVLIVGGGPIGLACAIEAQKNGLSYLILEKGVLVNSLFHYPVNMTFFSTSERLELGGTPFVSNNKRPTRREALEYYRRVVTNFGIKIKLFEKVVKIKKSNDLFEVISEKQTYNAEKVIIATGFYDLPYLLHVPGEDLPKVKHYYDDPHFYAFQKVLVIGAANSAVDAALETWRKGAEVSIVVRDEAINNRVKYWIKPDIENRIKEGSIKAYFNSTIKEIREKEVDISTPDGIVTIENDWVLAMTGYQPGLDFLKDCGIRLSEDGIFQPEYDEETQETNVEGLYLAGVICGGLNTHFLMIENSRIHAEKIISHILKNRKQIVAG